MNRRIQTATAESDNTIVVFGKNVGVYDSVTRFIRYMKDNWDGNYPVRWNPIIFKFARRSFAGAERIRFTLHRQHAWAGDSIFVSNKKFPALRINEDSIWLCSDMVYQLLGVGERTKKFSLWVKV